MKIEGVQVEHSPEGFRALPKASREVRQEMIILYSRVAWGRLSGEISLKCTLGQPILAI